MPRRRARGAVFYFGGHPHASEDRMRRLSFAIPVLFAACLPLPGGRSLTSLTVADKQGVSTLVADNGSTCDVAESVFERVRAGDSHACLWLAPGDARAPRTRDKVPTARRVPVLVGPKRVPLHQ